ncbi:ABC transporter ATP-binding protein [Alkalihalobacterium bogoriense]|uniref:ABC transporter ATP-binding protein n=1 Tax=Alkalihalobacterium bogoriense TaxID=246272 RepID=UPI00047E1626|nr:ABC transporter ATP-binding protein [Alkalihalobacterium bogoriense]
MKSLFYFYKQIQQYAGKTLYWNMAAMIFVGLLDGIGLLLLVPLLGMTGLVQLDFSGTPLDAAYRYFQALPTTAGLAIILSLFIVLSISHQWIQRVVSIKNAAIQHGFLRHLRVQTYELLLNANWRYFLKNRKSDLINIITAEIARASAGTNAFLQLITSFIFTIIQILLAFWLSPSITVFVLLCGMFLLLFSRKFLSKSLALGNRTYELGKDYLGGITDQMNGIKDIKSNTLEASRMDWYRDITKQLHQEQVAYTKLKTASQFNYKVASTLFIALFIFVSVQLFNSQGAQLMVILIIFSRLWPRVTGIQSSLEHIASAIPAFGHVIRLQQETKQAAELNKIEGKSKERVALTEGIECQHVYFRYHEESPSYALENINVIFPSMKMTAVVGRSGAGKSTLIDLLMGLNQPQMGEVLIDGQPLTKSTLPAWRNSISYVPQEPFLFNASIRENLQLVDENTTEEQLWEALSFASAADFVKQLPHGLDTKIGDRGVRLSGGERQRVVLARAILRQPKVLILDEATSALDTENEVKIQEALQRLTGKMTVIVIAHRLSTIRHADQVVVLEKGQVIQRGEFEALAKEKHGRFNHLLSKQAELMS